MKADNRTAKRILGDIGEGIAADHLVRNGYEVIERNYLRKWGEIDIIAKKLGKLHFVEVKSVTWNARLNVVGQVPHVTNYRPEENVHPGKLKRLARAMQTYLMERGAQEDFQLDVVTVRIDEKNRQARVEMIENVII